MNRPASIRFAPLGLIGGCVIFGLGSIIVAKVPVGAYAAAFWRLAVAALIFAVLTRRFGQKLPENRRSCGFALLAGVFLGLDLSLWHESIYAVGPGISTLLNSLQIFWLSAIGFCCFGERQSRLQLLGTAAAAGGIALIAGTEFGHNSRAVWGLVSGTVSGMMLALSMVFVRKSNQTAHIPILPSMLLISLGGMAVTLPPALLFNAHNLLPQTAAQTGWLIVYGAVMQCFAWGMIAYTIPLLSLALTGLLLLSEPVAALLIDFLFLDKPISTAQWIGVALTLTAIYLGSLQPKKAA